MVYDSFGDPITEERWHKVELCIKEFIRRHPKHWASFKKDLHENRTEFQLANEGDLKKSGFRNTAAFPVVYRKMTPQERLDDPDAEEDIVQVASLIEPLKLLLPGLIDPDKKGAPNKLYREFLRRFTVFQPGEKY